MKKNFELNTGEKGKEININLLQPDRFSVIIDGNKNTCLQSKQLYKRVTKKNIQFLI